MSRVRLFEEIRRERREGASIRSLADSHGVHRRTVRQAIEDATPPLRKTPERAAGVLGPWKDTIWGWLEADLEMPRKQRHTARRVWERLVGEHGVQVGESTVRRFVAEVKAELVKTPLVAVPQVVRPGLSGGFRVWKEESISTEITSGRPTTRRYTKQEKDEAVRLVFELRREVKHKTGHGGSDRGPEAVPHRVTSA